MRGSINGVQLGLAVACFTVVDQSAKTACFLCSVHAVTFKQIKINLLLKHKAGICTKKSHCPENVQQNFHFQTYCNVTDTVFQPEHCLLEALFSKFPKTVNFLVMKDVFILYVFLVFGLGGLPLLIAFRKRESRHMERLRG